MRDLLKLRHRRSGSRGDSVAYWEDHWSQRPLDHAIRSVATGSLRRVFERHVAVGSLLLEGGCGQGEYVVYERSRGVRAVGLDFAAETLSRLRSAYGDVPLVQGDVNHLPFRTGAFDSYYSGGVVEHFESGPDEAVAEAFRVLRDGGSLLVSVPYLSPLRRLLQPFRRSSWEWVDEPSLDPSPTKGEFWQYAFGPARFKRHLARVGFVIETVQGYGIVRGLLDVGTPLERAMNWRSRRARKAEAHTTPAEPFTSSSPSLFRRIVVSEDDSIPVVGPLLRVARRTCANMAMYVCHVPVSGGPTA